MGKKRLQFVWPKDGYKGRSGPRGFFGGLNDIMTNRGPDIFLQRKGKRTAIKPDFWGNWDSYHTPVYHNQEVGRSYHNGLWSASRGSQRYDPATRRYKEWSIPHDWDGCQLDEQNNLLYPRFTREEARRMIRRLHQHRRINPRSMGSEWTTDGPRRFQQEHDWFWQNAHRIGENRREGFHPLSDINQHLRMHQRWPHDLADWIQAEPWLQYWN